MPRSAARGLIEGAEGQAKRLWIPVGRQEPIRHHGQTRIGGIKDAGEMTAETIRAASGFPVGIVRAVL
jgi:hypothetical protein